MYFYISTILTASNQVPARNIDNSQTKTSSPAAGEGGLIFETP
jgi:hypothetical protein